MQLSPTYCNNCTNPETSNQCFTIPQLGIHYVTESCDNIPSYVAQTLRHEINVINILIKHWLDGLMLEPLPSVSTEEWISAHVDQDSPIYNKLLDLEICN